MADKKFDLAVELRGKSFIRNLETYKLLARWKPRKVVLDEEGVTKLGVSESMQRMEGYTFAVMHIGAPAGGMNAVVRSFVRSNIYRGNTVLGIEDGTEGLIAGNIRKMDWAEVTGWVSAGGAMLGTKRTTPDNHMRLVANKLQEFGIQGLLIVGGFEAFSTAVQFLDGRKEFPPLNIPILVVPSTISNNVPGTEFSLGCDTALNEITEISDRIRQSAQGTKRRVFIIETMGGNCGYLATLAGLAGGADATYIHEEKFTIKDLQEDIKHMALKMAEGVERGLILRNENCNENYNTEFIYRLFCEEGKGIFTTRMNVLGHMQQGGSPSPFDRNLGTKMAFKAVEWMVDQLQGNTSGGTPNCTNPDSICVLGIVSRQYKFTSIAELRDQTDFELRIPKQQWWLKLRSLVKVLAKHDSIHTDEGMYMILEDRRPFS